MKLRGIIFIVLFLICVPIFANRNHQITGFELLQWCKTAINIQNNPSTINNYSSDELMQSMGCFAYLHGAIGGYLATISFLNDSIKNKKTNLLLYCIPSRVTTEQIALIVVRYLENNPKYLNDYANFLVYVAIHDTFPCKQ